MRLAIVASSTLLGLAACGGSTSGTHATGGGTSGASTSSSSSTSTSTSSSSSGTGGTTSASSSSGTGGMPATNPVTFSYTPAWKGVTAVEVLGGFGQSSDWTAPFVKLAMDASGAWTGTAMLPAGKYPYVFKVTGDTDGPANYSHYYVDPALSAFVACPQASPTYDKNNPNPCSELTVPQPSPDSTFHLTGKVLYGGQPVAGYLVVVERDEPMSHHYYGNRTDAGSDGAFDLSVAPGSWRLQVLHPTFLTETDTQRDPLTLKALRRGISSAVKVSADVAFPSVEMQYLDYATLSPTGQAKLPTTFDFTVIAGASNARAAVYGTMNGAGMNIGDPWWTSTYGTATSAVFNGTFTTKQASETMVKTGENYFWGTWQTLAGSQAVTWEGESMVFPIKWN